MPVIWSSDTAKLGRRNSTNLPHPEVRAQRASKDAPGASVQSAPIDGFLLVQDRPQFGKMALGLAGIVVHFARRLFGDLV